jgi:16S rRNA processing protein RimM
VGRVAGHRGRGGEITVRGAEAASPWLPVRRFWIGSVGSGRFFTVERRRAYRDRLVLKLEGVDTADGAARLRGQAVFVERADAPDPGAGAHYVADLVGMVVVDATAGRVGEVAGVIRTGGTDILRVRRDGPDPGRTRQENGEKSEEEDEELLIPLAREFVKSIDAERRRIDVAVPRELWELNRPDAPFE